MHKPKILVITDDVELRALEISILEAAGFLAVAAKSEDVDAVENDEPDLIICDVTKTEGRNLCREICARKKQAGLALLVITEPADSEMQAAGLNFTDDVIETPIEPLAFVAKVSQLVERKRLRKEQSKNEKLWLFQRL